MFSEKKITEHETLFSIQIFYEILPILRKIRRDIIINVLYRGLQVILVGF